MKILAACENCIIESDDPQATTKNAEHLLAVFSKYTLDTCTQGEDILVDMDLVRYTIKHVDVPEVH